MFPTEKENAGQEDNLGSLPEELSDMIQCFCFRLVLPDNMTSEYRLLPVEWLTEIWRPDSFFKNAKQVIIMIMSIEIINDYYS